VSFTVTVIGNVPESNGVPASAPDVFKVSPLGSLPAAIFHWYGFSPPAAFSVSE
jgi:hypothetical protein